MSNINKTLVIACIIAVTAAASTAPQESVPQTSQVSLPTAATAAPPADIFSVTEVTADDDESRMLRTARRDAAYYYRKLTGEDAMANDGETTEAGVGGGADDDESRMLRPARRVARRTARRTARRHAAYYYRKLTGEDAMANDGETTE